MSATLGGLIKDYRLQKNISQLEIAFAMGWSEPSRLSRIEQGKVGNPSRDFLDKLIKVMKLEEEEKNDLLLAGNYLPSEKEISNAKKIYGPFINAWPYPAAVFDFSWRTIDLNLPAADIYNVSDKLKNQFSKFDLHRFEIVFDDAFIQNKYLKSEELPNWHEFLKKLLTQFSYLQKNRTKEDWYIKLLKKMINNQLFKTLWQEIQFKKSNGVIQNFGRKIVVNPKEHSKRLEFFVFLEPMMHDPRFYIDMQVPANKETFDYFKQK